MKKVKALFYTLLISLPIFLNTMSVYAAIVPIGKVHTLNVECTGGRFAANKCPTGQDLPTNGNVGDPFIAFSDLTYAPNSGWSTAEPTKGGVITIWGRNFGATRGTSIVTVNGVQLTAETDYVDTWAETNNPVPFLQSITFQINNTVPTVSGDITVTVGGITSNPVDLTVGAGSIYFVSPTAPTSGTDGSLLNPWHCSDLKAGLGAGNIIYFRGGTYADMCNGGKSNIWIKNTDTGGTSSAAMAFVGYPNELPFMDGITNGNLTNFNKCIVIDNNYMTISKFGTQCIESAIRGNNYSRIVGNDFVGTTQYFQGAGTVAAGSDGILVYGNAIHGGRSAHKLDHSIYFSGCQAIKGAEAAYNYIYDNNFMSPTNPSDTGYGALIVDNHQVERCSSNEQMQVLRIYNNLISCENYYARAIGIYDQSWDAGEAQEPEPALVYNNITINCGVADNQPVPSPVAYHNNGYAYFFNNSFLNSHGGLGISGNLLLGTGVMNNAFTRSNEGTPGNCNGTSASPNSHNSVFNCADGGTDSIIADPLITWDSTAYNPITVQETSPLKTAGTPIVKDVTVNGKTYTVVERDFYGEPRSLNSISIGAKEIR